jgi:hypothetical protein
MENRRPSFTVLPLPVVQKWAKSALSRPQLRAGINLARQLRFYPNIPDLRVGPCGDGMELRIEHPEIGRHGWLRAIFWVDTKSTTIYIVDLFWKKTNDSGQVARKPSDPQFEGGPHLRHEAVGVITSGRSRPLRTP